MLLTDQQCEAVDQAASAIKEGRELFTIGGYAGTGKTTISREILESVPGGAACAFTGKAASVLRSKGVPATTIHKLIYRWCPHSDRFIKCKHLPCEWILIDEGSMISGDLWRDLKSFGVPIVATGDPGQLEPVGEDAGVMDSPDFTLKEIHRQAAESPILCFAHELREGYPFWERVDTGLLASRDPQDFWSHIHWAEQIIVGRNQTRVGVNQIAREKRGFSGFPIVRGDRLVVLVNDYELGAWNGQILTVQRVMTNGWSNDIDAVVETDDGDEVELPMTIEFLGSHRRPDRRLAEFYRGRCAVVDYGYALTCHKAQGSEWGKVLVLEEHAYNWDRDRWRYTAATRAVEGLVYVG